LIDSEDIVEVTEGRRGGERTKKGGWVREVIREKILSPFCFSLVAGGGGGGGGGRRRRRKEEEEEEDCCPTPPVGNKSAWAKCFRGTPTHSGLERVTGSQFGSIEDLPS